MTEDAILTVLTELRSEIGGVRSDLTGLRAEFRTDIGELRTDIGELRTDIGEIRTDISEVKTRLSKLEVEVGQLRTQTHVAIGELTSTRTEIMKRMDRLQNSLNGIMDDVAVNFARSDRAILAGAATQAISDEISAMQRQIMRLRTDVEELKQNRD